MPYDPDIHHRRSIRLRDYDYTQAGAYFVTICAATREPLLGEVHDSAVILSAYGHVAAAYWLWLAQRYSRVELDAWVVMPNHLHGIIVLLDDTEGRGGSQTAPTAQRKPLGRMVGAYKTISTKRINEMRGTPGVPFWQRNYYEEIIRSEQHLDRVRAYIAGNPGKWVEDEYFAPSGTL